MHVFDCCVIYSTLCITAEAKSSTVEQKSKKQKNKREKQSSVWSRAQQNTELGNLDPTVIFRTCVTLL